MTRHLLIPVVLVWAALLSGVCRADARHAVTPELVCTVQHAIRFRDQPWTPKRCTGVAEALNATQAPIELLAIAINESDLRPHVIVKHGDRSDVGLLGIRCVHGDGTTCTNGPAAGLTIRQLQDPTTAIRVGAQILATKHGIEDWNGTARDGYAGKIAAIVAAMDGARVKVRGKRLRKLVDQIAAAVNNERRS
jgi:hypothetical protein